MRKSKGFTIIELLVVVAIIAILATIGFVSYEKVQSRSRDAERISNFDSVKTALGLYYEDYNHYPVTSNSELNEAAYRSECKAWGAKFADEVIPGLVPEYLPSLPRDPLMTSEIDQTDYATSLDEDLYCYIYLSNGSDYAFILHYANTYSATHGPSEIDWLSKPELVDKGRACANHNSGNFDACHNNSLEILPENNSVCQDDWTMPTNNAGIHAWKIHTPNALCW